MSDENPVQPTVNPFATINATNIPKNLLSYDGQLGKLFIISIKNFFLIIITLGIYSSWATNNIRRYTFGSFKIGDERLEYSGKGGQLFKGTIIILVSYLVIAFAVSFVVSSIFPDEYDELIRYEEAKDQRIQHRYQPPAVVASVPAVNPELQAVLKPNGEFDIDGCLAAKSAEECDHLYILYDIEKSKPVVVPEAILPRGGLIIELSPTAQTIQAVQGLIGIAALVIFAYFAKFSTARYRLTRAKWRGIGGGIKGVKATGYIALRLKRLFANIFSLGYLSGRSDLIANKYILNNAYIGKTKFIFEPDFKKLDKVNLITWILAIPTLFISRIWYRAALLNYKYQSLSIRGIKFSSSFTGGKLLWLGLSNILIIVFTLFIGFPITTHRSLKFFAENVRVMGNADQMNFIQQEFESETLGEGLNQNFDLGQTGVDFDVI